MDQNLWTPVATSDTDKRSAMYSFLCFRPMVNPESLQFSPQYHSNVFLPVRLHSTGSETYCWGRKLLHSTITSPSEAPQWWWQQWPFQGFNVSIHMIPRSTLSLSLTSIMTFTRPSYLPHERKHFFPARLFSSWSNITLYGLDHIGYQMFIIWLLRLSFFFQNAILIILFLWTDHIYCAMNFHYHHLQKSPLRLAQDTKPKRNHKALHHLQSKFLT